MTEPLFTARILFLRRKRYIVWFYSSSFYGEFPTTKVKGIEMSKVTTNNVKLVYNQKKRKLVLRKNNKVFWGYKFKGCKQSNIEKVFAYILANPNRYVFLDEIAMNAGLLPSKSRIAKTEQYCQCSREYLTNKEYFENYRIDDEIKKVFRRGKLPIEIVLLIFDLHYKKIKFIDENCPF